MARLLWTSSASVMFPTWGDYHDADNNVDNGDVDDGDDDDDVTHCL